MKAVLLVASLVLIVLGLHWIGQGTGLFVWPSNPVMDNHPLWAWYGGMAALVGAGIAVYAQRR